MLTDDERAPKLDMHGRHRLICCCEDCCPTMTPDMMLLTELEARRREKAAARRAWDEGYESGTPWLNPYGDGANDERG